MSEPTATRRQLIRAGGTATVLGLAGCVSSSAPDTSSGDTSGTSATTTGEAHEDHEDHDHTTTTQGDPDHEHHGDHHHEDIPDQPAASAEVRMLTQDGSHHFSPHVVWIEAGGSVTFVNESGDHSATAYAPGNDKPRRIPEGATAFDTGLLTEDGAADEVTFETPGVYDYYCIPHETVGMIGSIIVGEPDAHGQPGLSEPTEIPEATHEKIRGLNDTVNRALGHTHGEETESGDHEDEAESDHHDSETSSDHHDDETTESEHSDDGHHDETTESDHHDDDGHHG